MVIRNISTILSIGPLYHLQPTLKMSSEAIFTFSITFLTDRRTVRQINASLVEVHVTNDQTFWVHQIVLNC